MPDAIFEHPRLAGIYDALEPDRRDLDAYVDIADELSARSVLDLGCGTGVLALMLAERGARVIAVDPAAGSLAVAKHKPGANRVRWFLGDGTTLPPLQVDLVTMTGNAVQAIVDNHEWDRTLSGVCSALRPGGFFVIETRDPAAKAWQNWNRLGSYRQTQVPGVGAVQSWVDMTEIDGSLVSFRWTYVFASDGEVITSDSTLRFRERDEVEAALAARGFALRDVRDAPDRPGKEFVFFAQRADSHPVDRAQG